MASFVKHVPCGECGSKDNRALYDDGSSYCFGCKSYSKPKQQKRMEVIETKKSLELVLQPDLPEPNKNWLRQYLTDEQIEEFFEYHPHLDRHVYVHYGPEPNKIYWEARSVREITPKIISVGEKPFNLFGKWKETGVVVIVEDIVSAIKLSEYAGVLCLHGSVIPHKYYNLLGNIPGIKKVIIWLDADKLSSAWTYEKKFDAYGMDCVVVRTKEDPKKHSAEEILEIIMECV